LLTMNHTLPIVQNSSYAFKVILVPSFIAYK
jgi:hypothetical protein